MWLSLLQAVSEFVQIQTSLLFQILGLSIQTCYTLLCASVIFCRTKFLTSDSLMYIFNIIILNIAKITALLTDVIRIRDNTRRGLKC